LLLRQLLQIRCFFVRALGGGAFFFCPWSENGMIGFYPGKRILGILRFVI
jgi:hypothetical protein